NANLAPPGYYLLFLVGSNGVPSVASSVRLPTGAVDLIPPIAPGALTANGGLGSAALSWALSTDNTGVALYNVHRSATSGFAPSAANRIGQSRSEEHTSELQSRGHLVCRLLLEKKKQPQLKHRGGRHPGDGLT